MSIVVGDLDNDGQGDRVFFEAHHSTSLLSSETELLLVALTVVACLTVICWCVFFAIAKRKRLAACLDPHPHKSSEDGPSSRDAARVSAVAPPTQPAFPYHGFAHHSASYAQHLRNSHYATGMMLSPLPELPELQGSSNSFANPSFHPPGWKYTPENCGF
ncbi:unnamed protein product [Ixodes hexagonus]